MELQWVESTCYIRLMRHLPIAAFVLSCLIVNLSAFQMPCLERGDYAANALSVERAKEGAQILGAYSRFGYHHPGPIIFYAHALGELIFPWLPPHGAHRLIQIVINGVFLMGIWRLIPAFFNQSGTQALWLVIFVSWLTICIPTLWSDPWGPATVVLPVTLTVLTISALIKKSKKDSLRYSNWIWLAFSSAIAIQTHIATALVVGPVLAFSVLLAVKSAIRGSFSPTERRTALISLLAFALLFVPTLLDTLGNESLGNLGKIIQAMNKERTNHSLNEALRIMSYYYLKPFSSIEFLNLITLVILFVATPYLIFKSSPATKITLITIGASFFLGVLGAARTPGKLHEYIYWYQFSLAAALWAFLISALSERYFAKAVNRAQLTAPQMGVLSIMIALVVLFYSRPLYSPGVCSNMHALQNMEFNRDELHILSLSRLRETLPWPEYASLGLYLKRSGVKFCVPHDWAHMFGKENECDSSEPNKGIWMVKLTAHCSAPSPRYTVSKEPVHSASEGLRLARLNKEPACPVPNIH